MRVSKISVLGLIIALIYLMLFFSVPLNNYFKILDFSDEIIGLLSIIGCTLIILNPKTKERIKSDIGKLFIVVLLILTLGLISSYTSGYNVTFQSKLVDGLTLVKVPFAFYFVIYGLSDRIKEEVLWIIKPIVLSFLIVATFFCFLNLFNVVNLSYDVRFGYESFRFIYNNPGSLNERVFASFVVISTIKSKRLRYFFYFISVLLAFSTFRMNSIVTIIIWPILIFIIKRTKKLSISHLVPIILLSLIIGKNQINNYFFEGQSPRQLLFRNGFNLMKEKFPFGTGFSTYGSDQAAKNYSELYYQLGFSNIWGLQPTNQMFLHDTFWPTIFAQYGFFGGLGYLTLVIIQVHTIFITPTSNKALTILLFMYVLISSVGASIFLSAEGLTILLFMGLLTKNSRSFYKDKRKYENN